jgi:hypothetical protein
MRIKKFKNFWVPKALFGILPGRVTYVTKQNYYFGFNNMLATNHIKSSGL